MTELAGTSKKANNVESLGFLPCSFCWEHFAAQNKPFKPEACVSVDTHVYSVFTQTLSEDLSTTCPFYPLFPVWGFQKPEWVSAVGNKDTFIGNAVKHLCETSQRNAFQCGAVSWFQARVTTGLETTAGNKGLAAECTLLSLGHVVPYILF